MSRTTRTSQRWQALCKSSQPPLPPLQEPLKPLQQRLQPLQCLR
ncbi:MAG: hypothetical protein ACKVY0_13345 [Prosthecobacter sp.]